MTEPQPDNSFDYYGDDGQPVRRGVVLSPEDQQLFDLYFPETSNRTTTEETH
jgi:hypothetical protein